MNTIQRFHISWFALLTLLFLVPDSVHSQIVVPRGWENQDSVRVAGNNSYIVTPATAFYNEDSNRVARLHDSLGVNAEFGYGWIDGNRWRRCWKPDP